MEFSKACIPSIMQAERDAIYEIERVILPLTYFRPSHQRIMGMYLDKFSKFQTDYMKLVARNEADVRDVPKFVCISFLRFLKTECNYQPSANFENALLEYATMCIIAASI